MVAKRVLDVGVAGVALILLSPLLAVVSLLVRSRLGSPVLFRQERAGLDGQPFVLFKFRTMADERSADHELLPDEGCLWLADGTDRSPPCSGGHGRQRKGPVRTQRNRTASGS